jgi:hypothetical protein
LKPDGWKEECGLATLPSNGLEQGKKMVEDAHVLHELVREITESDLFEEINSN